MKKITLLLTALFLCISSHAEQAGDYEKIVTNRWSLAIAGVRNANHYFSDQEYSGGTMLGLIGEHGAFYKKRDNLSWHLDLSFMMTPGKMGPQNPAQSSRMSIYDGAVEYGVSYNWNPAKNLYLRAGGAFNLNIGGSYAPEGINNVLDFLFQPQFKAIAGIKYGWNFKKMGIHFFADAGVPFMGLMLVGSKYEGTKEIVNFGPTGLLKPAINHIKFSSFHNLQGYNMEIGLNLQFQKCSLILSMDSQNRWWNAYGVQNYKRYNVWKIGFCTDLVCRSRFITKNKYF